MLRSEAKRGYDLSQPLDIHGARNQSRTGDLLITNQLLYQLSYPGTANILPERTNNLACRRDLIVYCGGKGAFEAGLGCAEPAPQY